MANRIVLSSYLTARYLNIQTLTKMSKLYFFRHAQASYGAANYDQLSPKGEKQSAELGKYLVEKKILFDKIFVGPLNRQQHTFEIVKMHYAKNELPMPEPIILPELKEHQGPEGLKKVLPELIQTVPQIKKWYASIEENAALRKKNSLLSFQYFMEEWVVGNIVVEGIEPWNIFRKEVKKGLDAILENTEKGENIGAFTSGGTISSITADALNLEDRKRVAALNFSIRNASFSTFLYSKNQFNLLSFNELPHLQEELISFV